MTRLYRDHVLHGIPVMDPQDDANVEYVKVGGKRCQSPLPKCPRGHDRWREDLGFCTLCEAIERIRQSAAEDGSPEALDVLVAMKERPTPINHSKRYPLTLAQKQAKAARARAAKGRAT